MASGSASTPCSSAGSADRAATGSRPPTSHDRPNARRPRIVGNSNPADTERPMLNLTPDQRALGRANAHEVIGSPRRDFPRGAPAAPPPPPHTPPPPPPPLAPFSFGYQQRGDKPPVRAAIIGTGNEGC